jgi:hypothetical protein
MNKQSPSPSGRARKRAFLRRLAEVIKRLARSKQQTAKSQDRAEQE